MKRYLIIGICGVIVVAGIVLVVSIKKSPASALQAGITTTPVPYDPADADTAAPVSVPEGTRIDLNTSGGIVSVKNFFPSANRTVGQSVVVVKETEDYIILYNSDTSFEVRVIRGPNDVSRQSAEQDFLQSLDVTKAQACLLDVSESVADPARGLVKQSLSFCPPRVQ